MDSKERINKLRLIRTPFVGPVTYRQLLLRYRTAEAALAAIPELSARGGRKLTPITRDAAEAELHAIHTAGASLLILGDEQYPPRLVQFEVAPLTLTYKGSLSLVKKPVIAIVGARNASLNAMRLARHFAGALGEAGFVIVSGMARGIDRAAHEGSLATGTIAILANGIDIPYPKDNRDLYEQISKQGLILGEMPIGTQPTARLFPMRNRIIAALSQGCLVIEAAVKSGSLITAREAAERGCDVMAIPGSPLDPRAHGANTLIQDGAHLVQSPEDVEAILSKSKDMFSMVSPYTPEPVQSHIKIDVKLVDEARNQIMKNISHDPIDIDELGRWCHVSAVVLAAALLELELGGCIQRHLGNRVSRLVEMP